MVETIAQCPMIKVVDFCAGYMNTCGGCIDTWRRRGERNWRDESDALLLIKSDTECEREGEQPLWKLAKFHCTNAMFPHVTLRITSTLNQSDSHGKQWINEAAQLAAIHAFQKDLKEGSREFLRGRKMGGGCKLLAPRQRFLLPNQCSTREMYYWYKKTWALCAEPDSKEAEGEGPWTIAHQFHKFWLLFIEAWNRHLEPKICDRFLCDKSTTPHSRNAIR